MIVPGHIAGPSTRRPAANRSSSDGHRRLSDAELLASITGSTLEVAASLLCDAGGLGNVGAVERHAGALSRLRPAQRRKLESAVELARRLATARTEPGWRVRTPADIGERMLPAMRHLEREELRTLLLNTKNVVGAVQTVYVGNLAGSAVRVGEVFRDAVRRQAAALVVVHNHPSGDPTPSADDLRITAELAQAGRLLDIELLDHIVIGSEGWVSLRSLGAT